MIWKSGVPPRERPVPGALIGKPIKFVPGARDSLPARFGALYDAGNDQVGRLSHVE